MMRIVGILYVIEDIVVVGGGGGARMSVMGGSVVAEIVKTSFRRL